MWTNDLPSFAQQFGLTIKQAKHHQCTAEHLKARQDGGKDTRDNLVAACRYCNSNRHKRKNVPAPEQYRHFVQSRIAKRRWHGPWATKMRGNGQASGLNKWVK
jgi:5-methylcytosine-specific restriction endonuclease McrA